MAGTVSHAEHSNGVVSRSRPELLSTGHRPDEDESVDSSLISVNLFVSRILREASSVDIKHSQTAKFCVYSMIQTDVLVKCYLLIPGHLCQMCMMMVHKQEMTTFPVLGGFFPSVFSSSSDCVGDS